ncbi:hypothetical protein Scep_010044 [Stephania cephalantha]|uniref:Uncharacterized protein n=1 Tax=Stephania cephalantha TaxID=152367 RepID=A0AAP0PD04_9MAGN
MEIRDFLTGESVSDSNSDSFFYKNSSCCNDLLSNLFLYKLQRSPLNSHFCLYDLFPYCCSTISLDILSFALYDLFPSCFSTISQLKNLIFSSVLPCRCSSLFLYKLKLTISS